MMTTRTLKILFSKLEALYILGTKDGGTEKVDFLNEKIYRISVEVSYNDIQDKDYFLYLIDYKNSLSVDLMNCDLPDTDSSLFGVPTYYGTMQMLDPSVVREMTSTRYTANSLLFE